MSEMVVQTILTQSTTIGKLEAEAMMQRIKIKVLTKAGDRLVAECILAAMSGARIDPDAITAWQELVRPRSGG